MKKLILSLIILFLLTSATLAEVIEGTVKEEKKFGPWTVSCEIDVMMDKTDCKVFSRFYNNTSIIYVQPSNKLANQIVLLIPNVLPDTFVKMRVDKNELIWSNNVTKNDYGVIPFSDERKKTVLEQMKRGKDLYIRFSVIDNKAIEGKEEVTIKISLEEFSRMLFYYDLRTNNNKG